MPAPPENWRPEGDLRRLFNRLRFVERATSGTLRMVVAEDKEVKRPWAANRRYPDGTVHRLVIKFFDGSRLVAVASAWRYPDGTSAASGRHDPKGLLHEGEWYWTGPRGREQDQDQAK